MQQKVQFSSADATTKFCSVCRVQRKLISKVDPREVVTRDAKYGWGILFLLHQSPMAARRPIFSWGQCMKWAATYCILHTKILRPTVLLYCHCIYYVVRKKAHKKYNIHWTIPGIWLDYIWPRPRRRYTTHRTLFLWSSTMQYKYIYIKHCCARLEYVECVNGNINKKNSFL